MKQAGRTRTTLPSTSQTYGVEEVEGTIPPAEQQQSALKAKVISVVGLYLPGLTVRRSSNVTDIVAAPMPAN